jgi:hypothetical protein
MKRALCKSYFYKIENLINGNFYYGVHKTDNPNDNYMGSGKRIKYAIIKYGKENFKKEILFTFETFKKALDFESEFINEQLLLDPSCYNIALGGKGGLINLEHNYKFRLAGSKLGGIATMKILHERQINNPEYREKWLHALINCNNLRFSGKKHKEEVKIQVGKVNAIKQKGEGNSQYGTIWIHNEKQIIKIKKELIIEYENQGWVRGRKFGERTGR